MRTRSGVWLGLLVLWGCGDDDQVPLPPPPRFEACEVATPPPAEATPAPEVLPRLYLPAVRAGALWAYDAPLPSGSGATLLGGALPPGLELHDGRVQGAVEASEAPENAAIYRAQIKGPDGAPLELEIALLGPRVEAAQVPAYDDWGPYGVWSTNPDPACADNLTLPEVLGAPVSVFVSYPTEGAPLQTGQGEVAEGRWPVLLFSQANSSTQCEIFERYRGLHSYWASWGVIVVSIDNQLQNCQRATEQNIIDRAEGLLAALEELEVWDTTPGSRLYGRLDLGRVFLTGHSRGGGAALRAARDPRVKGVIDIQGVHFGFDGAVPPVPTLVLVANEDRDTTYPHVEPTEDALEGAYAWVNIQGAIHDYTADDVPLEPDDAPLITRDQQHRLTSFFTLGFMDRVAGLGPAPATPNTDLEALFYGHQGDAVVRRTRSPLGVIQRWSRNVARVMLDDFDDLEAEEVNLLGGAYASFGLRRSENVYTYAADGVTPSGAYRWPRSRRLDTHAGVEGSFTMTLQPDGEPLEVDDGAIWTARIKGPDLGDAARFTLTVEGTDRTRTLTDEEALGGLPLTNRFAQVEVPLTGLGALRSVRLELSDGSLLLDDVRLE